MAAFPVTRRRAAPLMRRNNRHWRPMPRAELTWTDRDVPGSAAFADIYYSPEDGLAESRHVFLQGSALPERWQVHPRDLFVVAETGFGTGLNFLLTWQAWSQISGPRPRLHFISIERYPLRQQELERALANWPQLADFSAALLAAYPPPLPGVHRLILDDAVTLDLWWAEAGEALADMDSRRQPLVDAWYLDGFAPARNEAMWDPALLQHLGGLSRPGATVATFTAAGAVRRALQGAGFAVRKAPGFGRKRERLLSELTAPAPPQAPSAASETPIETPRQTPRETPWDLPEKRPPAPRRALVIGAGLAGCATAAALARRGVSVSLLDAGPLAGGASGNAQGMLYTRLSRRHSPLADFAQLSFLHASRRYREMLSRGELEPGVDGELCGSFHTSDDPAERAALAPLLGDIPELAQVLDAPGASARLGIDQPAAGYWYPRSGWLSPAAVCRAWARRDGIHLQTHCGPLRLERARGLWRACSAGGELLGEAECAVIACAQHSGDIAGLDWLPLRSVRGQTTQLPAGAPFDRLRAVLCHEGYIAPAAGEHCIGATFDLRDRDESLRPESHRHNLDKLAAAVPAWREALAALSPEQLGGRVGFRCASPDYLPLVGPVPDLPALLERFAGLRQNARQVIPSPGVFMPGLYLNTGHGSRGLTSTPLAAELLASQVCNEPLPLDRELQRALAPARFPIRELGRNRR